MEVKIYNLIFVLYFTKSIKMKIEIRIPDNLSKEQEVLLIAKNLSKTMIQGQKLLSNGKNDFNIIEPEDTIKIVRYTKERKFKTQECSICNTLFQTSK